MRFLLTVLLIVTFVAFPYKVRDKWLDARRQVFPLLIIKQNVTWEPLRSIGVSMRQKISNCFRSIGGATAYARIAGFISTIRKMKWNIIQNIESVLQGTFQWAT